MKKIVIILLILSSLSCADSGNVEIIKDTSVAINISKMTGEHKYRVEFRDREGPVGILYTNKECQIDKAIWECK